MAVMLTLTIQDGSQPTPQTSKIEIPLQNGKTIANYTSVASAAWTLISPLINGTLVNAAFTVDVDISGFTIAVASAISDVQEKAEFVFRTANGFIKRLNLPTIVESVFGSAGRSDAVDVTDEDVAAFVTAIEDGFDLGGGTTVGVVNEHDEDVTTLVAARENWGKRRL